MKKSSGKTKKFTRLIGQNKIGQLERSNKLARHKSTLILPNPFLLPKNKPESAHGTARTLSPPLRVGTLSLTPTPRGLLLKARPFLFQVTIIFYTRTNLKLLLAQRTLDLCQFQCLTDKSCITQQYVIVISATDSFHSTVTVWY